MVGATTHVLLTGAGAPGAAGIIKCLQSDHTIKLTVADADPNAIGKQLCADFLLIPKGDDTNFVDELLSICLERSVDLLIPLVTKELFPLSKNKELFVASGTRVAISSPRAIAIANDKSACYHFLEQHKIKVPRYFKVTTVEEFIHAAFELGHPQKSFCFKPSISNGSRGVRIVSDSIDESEQLFNHKPYNLFITYAHALKILSAKAFPELLVSEYLPGEEYTVDCLAENGIPKLVVPRLREKMINGITVQGKFVPDTIIMDYCTQIIQSIGLHGHIGIQVKRAENKEALLLEINPRLQGTTVAAMGAGVNFPQLLVKQELNIAVTPEEMQIQWGKCFSRHWTEVYY